MRLVFVLLVLFPFSNSFACPEGQYQVKAHHRNGYIRYDGVVVKSTLVKAYCKDFSAAYLYVKDLFNDKTPKDWPHKEISKPWSEAEKQRVIEALENVPEILRSQDMKGIYRMLRSKDFPNPSTSAPEIGYIVLYDSAFSKNNSLDRVINHELAHLQFQALSNRDKLAYRLATDSKIARDEKLGAYWVPRPTGYVEADGISSIDEDYANNVEYYLYDPDKLKKVTPKVYDWLSKKFGEKLLLPRRKK